MGTVRRRSLRDYGRFAEAGAALILARLIVAVAPFRTVAALASWRGFGPRQPIDEGALPNAVAMAVRRVSRWMPIRCVCIHEGLAAQWMLRRRGVPTLLSYGVRHGEDQLTAHVWVTLNGEILIGVAEARRHALVATFPQVGR